MKLFGVEHGGDFLIDGLPIATMDVRPASTIVSAIDGLPANATVGLETFPDVSEMDDPQLRYWQELIGICQEAGVNIQYLDDPELLKYLSRQRWDMAQLGNELASGRYQATNGNERYLAEFQFGMEADFNYVFAVAREDAIFNKLVQANPDIAIVGLAHSDYFMLSPELRAQLGVDEYWRSRLDAGMMPEFLPLISEVVPIHQKMELSEPDPNVLTEREFTVRTYRAASLGRIAVDVEPEWIGSWEPSCRPYGLFEVYPDPEDPRAGTIEDRLGSAHFEGEFGEEGVIFSKEYIRTKVLNPGAYRGVMMYEAEASEDGDYVGKWRASGLEGDFVLRRGSKLFDPEPFLFGQKKLF